VLYVISCIDKPGHEETRAANRPDHLAYLTKFANHVFAAGPYLAEGGDGMTGSLLIMDFESFDDARSFADGDPYNRAGLFESVDVRRWKRVLPAD